MLERLIARHWRIMAANIPSRGEQRYDALSLQGEGLDQMTYKFQTVVVDGWRQAWRD